MKFKYTNPKIIYEKNIKDKFDYFYIFLCRHNSFNYNGQINLWSWARRFSIYIIYLNMVNSNSYSPAKLNVRQKLSGICNAALNMVDFANQY